MAGSKMIPKGERTIAVISTIVGVAIVVILMADPVIGFAR